MATTPLLRIRAVPARDALVLAPRSRQLYGLDSATQATFDLCEAAVAMLGCRYLVFDLGCVERVATTFLGHLVGLQRQHQDACQGEVLLCALQPPVREIFQIIAFDQIFRLFATVEEALAALPLL